MTDTFRPLPDDPSAADILAMFNADQTWILGEAGATYETAAVEVFNDAGGNHQIAIALQFHGRLNRTDEHAMARVLLSPDDALQLARSLAHTYAWLAARSKVHQ